MAHKIGGICPPGVPFIGCVSLFATIETPTAWAIFAVDVGINPTPKTFIFNNLKTTFL